MATLNLILFEPFGLVPAWFALPDSLAPLTTATTQIQTLVGWVMSHPVWAIATLLLAIVLLQMVADLVKRILKASLTFVLKLPLTLSQWIWQSVTARFLGKASPSHSFPNESQPAVLPQAVQIDQLISRLDTLREEQDQVVAELKTLLASEQAYSNSMLKPDSTSF
jgi:hypothetical protein